MLKASTTASIKNKKFGAGSQAEGLLI